MFSMLACVTLSEEGNVMYINTTRIKMLAIPYCCILVVVFILIFQIFRGG
jgi:hypothetical protein